jgi:predicted AAA+ superfamily ATPase
MKDISFPVGRVQILNMYPMNFYEFLMAEGKVQAAEIIKSAPTELPVSIHNTLMESLQQYMFIGGMPECVKVWCDTKSLTTAFDVQYSLTETYRQDFSKYAPYVDKRVLNGVLNSVAKNIGHQLKYTQLVEDFSGPTNKKAFDLLLLARVIQKISATSPASLPLGNNASEKRFKSILVDIGMMRTLNNLPANLEFMKNDLLSMYNGALAEHFAGQEFVSSGMDSLHFWSREAKSSSAEVDYLIEKNNMIFPVEIKGGASGKLKSMHLLLKEYPHISQGFILSSAAYGKIPEQKLTFLPLYFAYSLAINAF